jgi:hypothetical protein
VLPQTEIWNAYYRELFTAYPVISSVREKLVNHLSNDLQLRLTSGRMISGKKYIIKDIEDDARYGTYLDKINVYTCGNLSVVEGNTVNSPLYPGRCPAATVLVFFREKAKASRINLHNSPI